MSFFTSSIFRVIFGLILVVYGLAVSKGKGGGFFGVQMNQRQNNIIGACFATIGTILVVMGVIL